MLLLINISNVAYFERKRTGIAVGSVSRSVNNLFSLFFTVEIPTTESHALSNASSGGRCQLKVLLVNVRVIICFLRTPCVHNIKHLKCVNT